VAGGLLVGRIILAIGDPIHQTNPAEILLDQCLAEQF